MSDIADAADLLAAAREALLADLLPEAPKERRYAGLMIANVMAIAARELRLGADAARNEAARLAFLLGPIAPSTSAKTDAPSSADLAALRRALCAAIRAGRFDAPAREKVLAAELLRTLAERVAISNPKALRPEADAPNPAAPQARSR